MGLRRRPRLERQWHILLPALPVARSWLEVAHLGVEGHRGPWQLFCARRACASMWSEFQHSVGGVYPRPFVPSRFALILRVSSAPPETGRMALQSLIEGRETRLRQPFHLRFVKPKSLPSLYEVFQLNQNCKQAGSPGLHGPLLVAKAQLLV